MFSLTYVKELVFGSSGSRAYRPWS